MTASRLFPHEVIREGQDALLELVDRAIVERKPLVVHAPTGLGKTAAALSPALNRAVEQDLAVLFVTPRHTQHKLVLETLKKIKEKHGLHVPAVDIIGKKWLCLQEGVHSLFSKDFADFCRALREDKQCVFYEAAREKEGKGVQALRGLSLLENAEMVSSEKIVEVGKEVGVCPYELALLQAGKARVVVADYFYVFHPVIRETFLKKLGKELDRCIVIVDEAHNVPGRVKELVSERLTTRSLQRAAGEAQKLGEAELEDRLRGLQDVLATLGKECAEEEMFVERSRFVELVNRVTPYGTLLDALDKAGDLVREEQRQSSLGSVANFLRAWLGPDEGFARIFKKISTGREDVFVLSYRCLDPSLVTAQVITGAASAILMSGTLTPTSMYAQILGAGDCLEGTFTSPFPKKNRLNLVVPRTSTKFSKRSDEQYRDIAGVVVELVHTIPGNVAVFLPSYQIRDEVYKHLVSSVKKTVFLEQPRMSKEEKLDLLERFKSYKESGAVLLGVASGSFSEGVDLPGDLLRGVVVVGLPLQRPDLETKALIEYYDRKFGKGWEYGYVVPAFNMALQSAGRCIRSEKDRGVVVFLDERYAWQNYLRYFPPEWDVKITALFKKRIEDFFAGGGGRPKTLADFATEKTSSEDA
ncbi:ATP-dependent DNA helicase [Candidatus Woesearchaeota archaeon]|nr:MAG: ATP-dependent DNA helicase [Candidatus Woesearchaeota archaeon]